MRYSTSNFRYDVTDPEYIFCSDGIGNNKFVEDYGWIERFKNQKELSANDKAMLKEMAYIFIRRELSYDKDYCEKFMKQLERLY